MGTWNYFSNANKRKLTIKLICKQKGMTDWQVSKRFYYFSWTHTYPTKIQVERTIRKKSCKTKNRYTLSSSQIGFSQHLTHLAQETIFVINIWVFYLLSFWILFCLLKTKWLLYNLAGMTLKYRKFTWNRLLDPPPVRKN